MKIKEIAVDVWVVLARFGDRIQYDIFFSDFLAERDKQEAKRNGASSVRIIATKI